MQIELKQLVGELSTPLGPVKVPQELDGIYAQGILVGYIERKPNARIFGLRPPAIPALWPQIAAEVKKIRKDADISEYSGVTPDAIVLAQQEEEIEDEDE